MLEFKTIRHATAVAEAFLASCVVLRIARMSSSESMDARYAALFERHCGDYRREHQMLGPPHLCTAEAVEVTKLVKNIPKTL